MSLILMTEGEIEVLKNITEKAMTLRLFTNNTIPTKNMKFRDFQEVVGAGYAPIKLLPAKWTFIQEDNKLGVEYPNETFMFLSPLKSLVFGHYVTKQVSGQEVVMWAEKFIEAPYHISQRGDDIQVKTRIRLGR